MNIRAIFAGAEHLWKEQQFVEGARCRCCTNQVRIKGINTIGDLHKDFLPYFANEDAFDPNLKITDRYDAICPVCGHTKNTKIDNLIHGYFYCDYCNSLGVKKPEIVKYLVNKSDANLSFGSHKKVMTRCPGCGNERLMEIESLYKQGYNCAKCGDGVSFPEKFLSCALEQLNVNFIKQLSSAQLTWCDKYKYDFYMPEECVIIEAHGEQHYKDSFSKMGGRTAKDEQDNDERKEGLAKKHGINFYIVLDCRHSEIEWIKNSILNSQLAEIYDLSNIDWKQCEEFATSNLIKEVCNYWSEHNGLTTSDLAKIFKTVHKTIWQYLRQGAKLGWCNYSAENERAKKHTTFS